jgi:hypothetical protein
MGQSRALTTPQTFTKTLFTAMPAAGGTYYAVNTNEMPPGIYRIALVLDGTFTAGNAIIRWYPKVANDQTEKRTTQNQGGTWVISAATVTGTWNPPGTGAAGDYAYLTCGRESGNASFVQDIPLPFGLLIWVSSVGDAEDVASLTLIATRIG